MIRLIILVLEIVINTILSTIVLMIVGLFNPYSKLANLIFYQWSWLIIKISGVKLNVHGFENFDTDQPFIVAANHRHLFDIPILAIASKLNIKFAAKKELFKVPVFGLALKLIGTVKIDRANNKKALGVLKKIEAILRKHSVSLVIFPEGTRNKRGKGLTPFKKGAFMTSLNSGIPILPVSINGSDLILQSFRCKPREITVYFHKPIEPNSYELKDRTNFMNDTNKVILSKLDK
jgi:1-acyl-sn-glycerol-3-phosphate acyltransferase